MQTIVIGRLSKRKPTDEATEMTIESSMNYAREYLEKVHSGPIEFRYLGEQISGMVVDRATIQEVYELLRTGEIDLILVEDLGRIYRNPRFQYVFVQDVVDFETRLISVADGLDTPDENWETMLSVAAVRHGLVVPDTRRRVVRSAKGELHHGGMVLKTRFGFRKLTREEANSGNFGPAGLRKIHRSQRETIS